MRKGQRMTDAQRATISAGRRAQLPSEGARFWAKVDKSRGPDACWIWTAACGNDGYGRFMFRGVVLNAHRVAMILHLGSVPADRDVDHFRCKERRCVNPAHLRLATELENALENNESPHAKNARKTHCIRGHEFNSVNTTYSERGRSCRVCRRKGGREESNQLPVERKP